MAPSREAPAPPAPRQVPRGAPREVPLPDAGPQAARRGEPSAKTSTPKKGQVLPVRTAWVAMPLKAVGRATSNYFMIWPRIADGNLDAMVYNSLMASMTAGGFAGRVAPAAGGQAKLALGNAASAASSSSAMVSSPQNMMPTPFLSQPSLANVPMQLCTC